MTPPYTVTDGGPAHTLRTLAGGTRLITAPMRERASAAVAFMFPVGSRFERWDNAGLAHFIEHMVFKGGRRFPTAKAISEEIEAVGGVLNADTDREATVFWTRVPRAKLGLAIGVLSDMLLHPLVEPDEVAKERLVVLEELRMTADNPQDHVHTLFDEVMWPDHPLGWDIAGREETVRSFERQQCLEHLALHYRPEHMVVSIAGAVDSDEASELLEGEMASAADGVAAPPFRPATPMSDGDGVRLLNKRTEQANIVLGGRSSSYIDDDRHAVDVLNGLLGDGMSSRLFLELRERKALAYDVHSFTIRLRDSGALAMYIGCEPKRATEAIRAAIRELERLASEPIPDADLVRTREYLKGRLLLGLESTSAMGSFLGQQELLTGEIVTPADVMAHIDSVLEADVQRAATAVLQSGLRASVVGPFRDAGAFGAALGSS